jgi:drug/metabolite transporter (DMT)-like permease
MPVPYPRTKGSNLSWVAAAIISAALSGMVAIVDSHLLSRRLPGLNTYLLPLGIFHGTVAVILLLVRPFPADVPPLHMLAALGTGAFSGIGSVMFLNAVRHGEISRIIPVINTSPIFVALMAVPFLGEAVTSRDWSGIVLTIAGAVLISVQTDGKNNRAQFQKSFFILLLCSLLFAISTILTKYALESLSFWNLYSANAGVMTLVFIAFAARPVTFRELRILPARNNILLLTLIAQSVIVVAIVLSNLAIQTGPVALASTVMSTRPAFVFLYSIAVSRLLPAIINEPLSRGILLLKLAAILMITGGVTLLTL